MYKINPKKLIPNKKEDITPKILSTLSAIHFNLKSIASITSLNKVQNKKQIVQNKKEKEKSEKIEKEVKKETFKPKFRLPKFKMPSMPRLGIFDFIKNFLMMAIFGFLFVNLFNHLPKLKEILNVVVSIGTFLGKTLGGLLEGLVAFIDFSYDKFDSFKAATKNVLGENYQKTFDGFTSALNQYVNLLLLGSLALMGSGVLAGGGGKGGKGKGGPKGGPQAQVNPKKASEKVTSSANRPKPSSTGPKITGSVVDDVAGQAGKKAAAKGASRFLTKGVFVIGPLIDFGIRTLVFKEAVDRAAVGAISTGIGQAIGASLGGVIGGIVGSVVPFVGNLLAGGVGAFVGGLIGGFIGDWIGTSLYEVIKANQGKTPKVQKKEKGGQVTRNGRPVGGNIKRTVKKAKKSPARTITRKPNPGKNVGGKKEIVKLFPSPDDPKKRNPLKTLEFAANRFNADPLWGPLMGAAVSASMGEQVDKGVYRNVARNFGFLVQNMLDGYVDPNFSSFNSNVLAMAEGGIIPPPRTGGLNQTSFGEKFGDLMAKSFQAMINNSTNDIFQNIMRQYKLEDFGGGSDATTPGGDPGSAGGELTSIDINGFSKEDVDALGRMVAAESARESPLGKAGVLSVILNRYRLIKSGKVSPGAFNVINKNKDQITIRDVLFAGGKGAGNQFLPYANGSFDKTSSSSGSSALATAIQAGGTDPELFKQNLIKTYKLSEADADYVTRSISFSNPDSRGSRPFNTREVRVGNHVFQQSPNAQLTGKIGKIDASITNTNELSNAVMMKGGSRPSGFISSEQGMRGDREHKGVDVTGGPWGINAPLTVIQPGQVIYAGWQDPQNRSKGWGQFVIVKHNNGLYTLYAHLSKIKVREGQPIKVGDDGSGTVIGLLGNTGRSTAPHLHFEIATKYTPVILTGHLKARDHINNYVTVGGKVVKSNKKFDVLIPLDHVSDKSLIGNPNYPSASMGAEGQERKYQEQAAAQVKAHLEKSGLRVKIMKPEDYGSYAAYDAFIREQSKAGAVTVPIHLDAVTSAGGKGALTRIRAGDAGDRALANKINPVLQKFAGKHGLSYGGMDTESNRTVNQTGSVGSATLVELGVQAELRRKFGPNFMQHPEVRQLLKELSNAIRHGIKPNKLLSNQPIKPQQISSISKPTNVPQQIAKWDTAVIPVQERVIATRIVEKQVPIPVAAKSTPAIFPEERANVNTDRQREVMAVG